MGVNLREDNADLFTLVDEDGVEQTFEFVEEYEENGSVYYALVPYYDDPNSVVDANDELVVLKVEQDETGNDILSTIDDDDEYERIGNILMNRIQENFDN